MLSAGYYDAYYLRAQKIRTLIKQDFDKAFQSVDTILTPATPSAAFELNKEITDPVEMYLNDIFTVTVNMAGSAGYLGFLRAKNGQGLPMGLQLIGKAFDEETLFRTAGVLEDAAGILEAPAKWW